MEQLNVTDTMSLIENYGMQNAANADADLYDESVFTSDSLPDWVSDQDVIDRLQRTGSKSTQDLIRTGHKLGDDKSSNDFAVACEIARLVGRDPISVERIMRRLSHLRRGKWTQRTDYLERTIRRAIRTIHDDPDDGFETWPSSRDEYDARGSWLGHRPTTPLGNAERFRDQHKDRVRYCVNRKDWLVYNDNVWEPDVSGVLMQKLCQDTVISIYVEAANEPTKSRRNELIRHAVASESKSALESIPAIARGFSELWITIKDTDTNRNVLTVENGTVDLRNGELRDHDPADMQTRAAPTRYVPGAKHPVFDKVLHDATNGDHELVAYYGRVFGLGLRGANLEEIIRLLLGPTQTSKSTLLEAVAAALGSLAAFLESESLSHGDTAGPRPDLMKLIGARMVLISEAKRDGTRRSSRTMATNIVKRLASNEVMSIRDMYSRTIVDWVPDVSVYMAANEEDLPEIDAGDDATWRRLEVLPFVHSHSGHPDPRIRATLKNDPRAREAVLAWLIEGLMDYDQRGGLDTPQSVLDYTAAVRGNQNLLNEFFKTCLIIGGGDSVFTPSIDIRTAYLAFLEHRDDKYLDDTEFGRLMAKFGMPAIQKKVNRKNTKVRINVTLSPAGQELVDEWRQRAEHGDVGGQEVRFQPLPEQGR